MSQTWSKKKNGRPIASDPFSRVDVFAARRAMRDCYLARNRYKAAVNQSNRRLDWVLAVTLLRVVGHALHKVDARRSPEMKAAIAEAHLGWKANPRQHAIFHEFIEAERNSILKEYRLDPGAHLSADTEVEDYLLIGDQAFSPVGTINAALEWWEDQLDRIEAKAEAKRNGAKA